MGGGGGGGGGGAESHEARNSLRAGVQGPLNGPGISGVILMLSDAISSSFWTIYNLFETFFFFFTFTIFSAIYLYNNGNHFVIYKMIAIIVIR